MNGVKAFKNLNIGGIITDLVCTDGKITQIGASALSGVDFGGRRAYAGLVDIHTHGMGGVDTMDADIKTLARLQADNGTTSFLPTTMTASFEKIKAVLEADVSCSDGAQVLGFHLEGPYINERYAGAQNRKYIRLPDPKEFAEYDNIGMITVAPELEGAADFIRSSDAVIALGHTEADYDTGVEAARAGARCLTHTFNAMPPLHHRNPSLVGAAFDEDLYVQVICDGIHIHPAVIRMLYKLFGAERMVLISDSMRAAGLADGDYEFGALTVQVRNKIARTLDGALAGSTSTLFDCVKAAIRFGIPAEDAFKMASETPARLMGVNKGVLKPGYDCDFIVLDDSDNICAVVSGGEVIRNKTV